MIKTLKYLGDPILRVQCKHVEKIDEQVLRIAHELVANVLAPTGSGLAAHPIGSNLRIFVVNLSDETDEDGNPYDQDPKVFINPVITSISKEKVKLSEGCLSIPNFYEELERPVEIDIEALDITGKPFIEKGLKRWRSRCVQHEMDHLEGVLFIDRFPENLKKKHRAPLEMMELRFKQAAMVKGDPFKKKG